MLEIMKRNTKAKKSPEMIAIKTLKIFVFSSLFLPVSELLLAQTFPQDFDYSYRTNALIDAGLLWNINSNFHPLAYRVQSRKQVFNSNHGSFKWVYEYLDRYIKKYSCLSNNCNDGLGLLLFPGIGIAKQNGAASRYKQLAIQPFIWADAVLRRNWYSRMHLRFTNVASSLSHYSGRTKGITRAGFNTAEFDQLLIGYRNDWAVVEYGRSREIWGPFAEDNLLLAGNAPPWERLMIQITHRRLTYRWFYGYLETKFDGEDNIHRYIVGKVLQYRNRSNLVISLGEVISLAGPNRSVDYSLANPLALSLEVENNLRENDLSGNHVNEILFANFDWLPVSTIRLAFSFALDEFQIDHYAQDEDRADALGYQGRIAWTPMRKPVGLTLFGYGIRNDTYFVQHEYGYTNLVNHDQMISHPIGNDADEIAFGARIVFPFPVMIELTYGQRRWGDNSLLNDPYVGYEAPPIGFRRVPFPSGQVRTNRYLSVRLDSQLLKGLSVNMEGHIDLKHSGENSALEVWTFTARYQIPFLITEISN